MKALKMVGYSVAGLVVLLVLALLALTLWFDPNKYKADIERVVEQQTHRKLTLQGDLTLKVFPWLALQMGPAQLAEKAGEKSNESVSGQIIEQPFVSFQSARLSVKLWPLLKGQVEIGNVQLVAPSIRLVTDADGRHNWDDLTASKSSAADESAQRSGDVNATIAGIDIQKGEVIVDDKREHQRTALHDFSLRANGIGSGKPFDLKFAFALEQNAITTAQVNLAATVMADWQNKRYALSKFNTEIAWRGAEPAKNAMPKEGLPIVVRAETAAIDLAQQSLQLDGLQLNVGIAQTSGTLTGKDIIDAPKIAGHLSLAPLSIPDFLKQLNIARPATRDSQVLKRVSFESDVLLTSTSVALQKIKLQLDDTTASGEFGVADIKAKALRFDLDVDHLDFDRYLPPVAETSAKQATKQSAPTPIPVDSLRALNARGDLRIADAKFSGLKLTKLRIGVAARDGDVRIAPAQAALYGGTYNGEIVLNVAGKQPRLALTAATANVDFAPMLKDMLDMKRIAGHGNFNAKLNAAGADTNELLKTLSGTLDFNVKEGAYEGMDLWYEIRRARAVLRQQTIPTRDGAERTAFNSIQGTGVVTNGVFANQDLLIATQYLKVDGKGSVDLVGSTMDYRLNAKVLRIPADGTDAAAMGELVDAEIPIKVTGAMASPTVRPDLESLVKAKVKEIVDQKKEELKQKLEDKLKDLFNR